MQIKLTLGDSDRIALVLPAALAGQFTELLSRAQVFERDGYYSTSAWKVPDQTIRIEFTTGAEFVELDAKTKEANKQAEEANSARWEEQRKRQAAEKERDTLKAQLEVLQSVGGCRMPAPVLVESSELSEAEQL